jgi:hypothetical protein
MDLISHLKSYLALQFVAFTFWLTINKDGKKILENLPTSWQTLDLQKCISMAKTSTQDNAVAIKTGRVYNPSKT